MDVFKTKIDDICLYLMKEEGKSASFNQICDFLEVETEQLDAILTRLESSGVCEIKYKPLKGKLIILKQIHKTPGKLKYSGKLVNQYQTMSHGITAQVQIKQGVKETTPTYTLGLPSIAPYTKLFLDQIRDELAHEVKITTQEIFDRRQSETVIKKFHHASEKYIGLIPGLSNRDKLYIFGLLLHKMYGLGEIELLLADDNLEEISINGSSVPLSVFHKKYGWLKTNIQIKTEEQIYNLASQIGRKSGREITVLSPILDTYLVTGDRVSATLFPISTSGNTITIRKFARDPWTVTDFMAKEVNTFSSEIGAFLWLSMQYEMNMLISGGTASGKTSLLNTLTAFIPPQNRIVTVEDTRELNLPRYLKWNWVPLTTRDANVEGKGEVSMLNLIRSSLRLRPDRIVIGEVRTDEEAQAMFEAMHTGHAVYSTMHADSSEQVIRRLMNPPFEISPSEMGALQLVIVQHRDRRKGYRRTYEISEVINSASGEISLNRLFLWHPRKDNFQKTNDSLRIFEELNLHTGMNPKEISQDLKEKQIILDWMTNKKINNVHKVGEMAGIYYREPEVILKAAKKNLGFDKVL